MQDNETLFVRTKKSKNKPNLKLKIGYHGIVVVKKITHFTVTVDAIEETITESRDLRRIAGKHLRDMKIYDYIQFRKSPNTIFHQ